MSKKFLTARKRQMCSKCNGWIEPGQAIYKETVAGFIHASCEGFDIIQQLEFGADPEYAESGPGGAYHIGYKEEYYGS